MLIKSLLLGCATVAMMGCGDEIVGQLKCSTDNDCIKKAGDVYDTDAGTGTNPPQCCNNVCVVAGSLNGCASGYRFLTSLPGYGACVEEPMCPVVQHPDMSVPADLSEKD